MSAVKQFIENLSMRERIVLGLGVLATVALLVYALLLEPWYRELDRLRSSVPQKAADLAWMEKRVPIAIRLRARNTQKTTNSNTSLLSIVENSADKYKVPIRQINPAANGEVRIWFRETEFDPWLRWLEAIKAQGIDVTAANVDRAASEKVNIRLTVQKSAL